MENNLFQCCFLWFAYQNCCQIFSPSTSNSLSTQLLLNKKIPKGVDESEKEKECCFPSAVLSAGLQLLKV